MERRACKPKESIWKDITKLEQNSKKLKTGKHTEYQQTKTSSLEIFIKFINL